LRSRFPDYDHSVFCIFQPYLEFHLAHIVFVCIHIYEGKLREAFICAVAALRLGFLHRCLLRTWLAFQSTESVLSLPR
jgi:hypothetical protein